MCLPFLTIIQRVLAHGHDLLIKAAEPVTGPTAVLVHPTDRHLMRKCPCPVWMIRPERHVIYRRILAAIECDVLAIKPEGFVTPVQRSAQG